MAFDKLVEESTSERITFKQMAEVGERGSKRPGWGRAAQAEERARTYIWRQARAQDN